MTMHWTQGMIGALVTHSVDLQTFSLILRSMEGLAAKFDFNFSNALDAASQHVDEHFLLSVPLDRERTLATGATQVEHRSGQVTSNKPP